MKSYIVLLRGINVGGKNKVPMAELKNLLQAQGCQNVTTYINSGNIMLSSNLSAKELTLQIEKLLPAEFVLDTDIIKVLVLTSDQINSVVTQKPKGFGEQPDKYHYDVIFLMDVSANDAMTAFSPRQGVDRIWPGKGVIYSERLSAERTKSRLNKIMASPVYKSMTIRGWNTTKKLAELSGVIK